MANLLTAALFTGTTIASFSIGAAVFNLMPLPGADGEMLLASLLPLAVSPVTADRITRTISDVFIILFWCVAVYLCLTGLGGGLLLIFAVGMLISRLSVPK